MHRNDLLIKSNFVMSPKNIHKIFIPQKIFIFLKTQFFFEIQDFEPQKMSLRMYEHIRVPPNPLGPDYL